MLSSGSFHSPNATEKRYWKKILSSSTEPFEYKLKSLSSARGSAPRKSQLSGLILGGNLASLITLMGTPWNPRFPKGSFLFLEEVSEAPYRLERLLIQLSYHQDFGHLNGVVAGHYTDCPRSRSILKTWSEEKNIPLWGYLPSGHERSNLPIVLGDTALLQRKSEKEIILTLPKPVFGC
jgi:muramoyltetrapeptide carboxypeptidase